MNVFVLLNTKEDILKNVGNRAVLGQHRLLFFPTMEVNGAPKQPGYKLSSKYLHLCSAEQRHSYRFGTSWGWVNDDRIFIFGWAIPLNHWSQTQFLEGHSSAQFSSNPNQTHLIQLIKLFRITRNFQAGVIWSWLELNSAELRPSRNWVWDHSFKSCLKMLSV